MKCILGPLSSDTALLVLDSLLLDKFYSPLLQLLYCVGVSQCIFEIWVLAQSSNQVE